MRSVGLILAAAAYAFCGGAAALAQTLQYSIWTPQVIAVDRTSPVTLEAVSLGTVTRISLAYNNGSAVDFTNPSANFWQISVSPALALQNYVAGENYAFVGFVDLYNGATRAARYNLLVPVREPAMPTVEIKALAPDAQKSRHILNLRDDSLYYVDSGAVPSNVVARLYNYFADSFDFAGTISQVNAYKNRFYQGVRSAVSGIGQAPFNSGAQYGSPSRLLGVIHYPVPQFYDLAETASLHEMGHRWCCFLNHPAVKPGRPHWALGDPAYGIMGWSDPVTLQGYSFPYALDPQPNGTVKLTTQPSAREFNNLELYLMGLADASEVAPMRIFTNQNQAAQIPSGTLQGPLQTVTIGDIQAMDGVRVPAAAQSQKDFVFATIVLSRDRLLNADEMAFFDFMASRGEASTALRGRAGLVVENMLPFRLATRSRATLSTTVCPECAVSPPAPAFSAAGFANGGSLLASSAAPGLIVIIYGTNMGPQTLVGLTVDAQGRLTTNLSGTRILFDGVAAPMVYTSSGQVAAVVPYSVAGKLTTQVQVEYQGQRSTPVAVNVSNVQPAIFTLNSSGTGQAAALNLDYSVNGQGNACARGSYLMVYATGEGQTIPPGDDGKIAGSLPLPVPALQVKVFLDGVEQQVTYAGAAPGNVAGVMQINFRIDPNLAVTGNVRIEIEVGGVRSRAGVTIAVK